MVWDQTLITPVTAIGGLLGTLVTAVATFFLWRVTKVLANETTRMVEASSQPHIVATLDPNPRSLRHFDLNVANTGNGTAYDIQINFSPALQIDEGKSSNDVPLTRISVLKPGHQISSYVSGYEALKGMSYTVTISWHRNQKGRVREENVYTLDMKDVDAITKLGSDPLIEMSEHVKKFQEDFRSVAHGSKRLQVDGFMTVDRLHERRTSERQRRVWRQQHEAKKAIAVPTSTPADAADGAELQA